jgi:hypothetical protein
MIPPNITTPQNIHFTMRPRLAASRLVIACWYSLRSLPSVVPSYQGRLDLLQGCQILGIGQEFIDRSVYAATQFAYRRGCIFQGC